MSRDMAEDVVQDAMLRACARTALFPDCPARFANRMVRNLAVDCLRRCRLERRICAEWLAGEEEPAPSPHATLEAAQGLALLTQALGTLPQRGRTVFLRHRLDSVPQKEIAREIGLSPARVHALIREAHDLCARTLAQAC
ncbi:MAG TPA: sigma-70 family RNA polymerase sigma factor [Paracoccaceae bacterium]|nr:sigma-70 family RNA polymerase sigma factor [Paracoccaceae bacterium]